MDKKALKKLKNREAAARCRNRRKQLIDDLTDLTEKLEAEKAKISNEVCNMSDFLGTKMALFFVLFSRTLSPYCCRYCRTSV